VKKILTILLLGVHIVTQAGTVLQVHYCMGDLASVTIGEDRHQACSYCGMKSKSCCHDNTIVIKSDGEAFITTPVSILNPPASLFEENLGVPLRFTILRQEFDVTGYSDTVIGSPPIYLMYRVFRI
jgi:hypothetical protein